uniref:G_PROTEIN_RECEP_F1_2 domain-containing protein n=1 Tax=Steinernema glaseri TaxID=37863 RepID=A0A1I7Y1Y3_9BILA
MLATALNILQLVIALPYLFIIATQSPPELHIYRNTLLNYSFWFFLWLIWLESFRVPLIDVIDHALCFALDGLASVAFPYDLYANLAIMIIIVNNFIFSLVICFFYRYCQLAHPNVISKLSSHHGILFWTAIYTTSLVVSFFMAHEAATIMTEKRVGGTLYACINHEVPSKVYLFVTICCIIYSPACCSMVVLTFLCVKFLRKRRSIMTTRTYRLQLLLTANLISLLVLPFLFDGIPFMVILSLAFLEHPSLVPVGEVAMKIPLVDGILTCVVTVGFITPYRMCVYRFLRRLAKALRCNKQLFKYTSSVSPENPGSNSNV